MTPARKQAERLARLHEQRERKCASVKAAQDRKHSQGYTNALMRARNATHAALAAELRIKA